MKERDKIKASLGVSDIEEVYIYYCLPSKVALLLPLNTSLN